MNTRHYHALIYLFFTFGITAQTHHDCGTTFHEQTTTYDFVQKQRDQIFISRNEVNDVPIKIHIIGAFNGALAIDSSVVFDELASVNTLYADAGIHFVHCGAINYINDNDYVSFKKNIHENLCDIHDKPNVINIYFAPNLLDDDGSDLCGYAYNFDIKPRVFMDKGCSSNGSTLAHELGHSFSLLHTHSTSNGEELANGSNCSIAGDLLCDTPADPTLSNDLVNTACQYTGTELDNQQNPYMPDVENIMSYSRKVCRIQFSQEQLLQIEDFYSFEGWILECTPDITPTQDLTATIAIEIYPNPSQASVFIKNIPKGAGLELIDLTGKKLWQTKNPDTVYELTAFQNLAKGVYLIRVMTDDQFYTHKIIRM